jgi:translation initiation factor 1
MDKKNKPDPQGYVYSTDPDFKFGGPENQEETLLPNKQRLMIRLDSRHRAGKSVTLVEGFIGKEEDLQELGKKLKTYCGTGGSAKEGEIIIQGDQRDRVLKWLLQSGYASSKKK